MLEPKVRDERSDWHAGRAVRQPEIEPDRRLAKIGRRPDMFGRYEIFRPDLDLGCPPWSSSMIRMARGSTRLQ
jgi:hypothetical protein